MELYLIGSQKKKKRKDSPVKECKQSISGCKIPEAEKNFSIFKVKTCTTGQAENELGASYSGTLYHKKSLNFVPREINLR